MNQSSTNLITLSPLSNEKHLDSTKLKPFNTLPNDEVLGLSKLKAFADEKINMAENYNLFWEGQKTLFSFSHNFFKRVL